mmetsp:Transcript_40742/g.123025  ORF Transcript_40742/g.123025 Transcript_40742/m.123025 type:complete len:261 (-) Transcript_40742:202-984(-)
MPTACARHQQHAPHRLVECPAPRGRIRHVLHLMGPERQGVEEDLGLHLRAKVRDDPVEGAPCGEIIVEAARSLQGRADDRVAWRPQVTHKTLAGHRRPLVGVRNQDDLLHIGGVEDPLQSALQHLSLLERADGEAGGVREVRSYNNDALRCVGVDKLLDEIGPVPFRLVHRLDHAALLPGTGQLPPDIVVNQIDQVDAASAIDTGPVLRWRPPGGFELDNVRKIDVGFLQQHRQRRGSFCRAIVRIPSETLPMRVPLQQP